MSGSLSSTIGSILFGVQRSFGSIIPDVTVREQSVDELEITQHPVENTSVVRIGYITDHAIKRPPTLTVEYGFTNAQLSEVSLAGVLQGQLPDLSLGNQRTRQVYEQLLSLQASRVPFQIVTGKRLYDSMLIQSLSVTTDPASENVLLVSATCRQIVIVSTSTTTITPQAPAAQQANPASTAGVTDQGPKQLAPVANQASLLNIAAGWLQQ